MSEAPAQTVKETNPLVEKIGKDKLRAVAALGVAAAGLFGLASGKANAGAGVAIETTNPFTGVPVAALVDVESTDTPGWQQLGISGDILNNAKSKGANGVATVVRIGGVSVRVGYTEMDKGDRGVVLLAVHPAADVSNARSQREAATREMLAKK